jgi:hypothetical protein
MSRRLIHVPVVHDAADLGSMADAVRVKVGDAAWRERQHAIDRFWAGVRDAIDRLGLKPVEIRIYQDGLPICGREADLVRDLAAQGSHNHRLVLELMNLGAKLTGTESPELLMEQLALDRELVAHGLTPPAGWSERATELLIRRDAWIASRIAETLGEEEVGVLFLGALHRLETGLPADLRVEIVTTSPRSSRS